MDLVVFHQGLLGRDPNRTPAVFHVSDLHRRLYDAYPAARGFSTPPTEGRHEGRFLATLVLALAQTKPGDDRKVYLFVPRFHEPWARTRIEGVARHTIRCRKKDAVGVRAMQAIFRQLTPCGDFAQVSEPDYWVAFGFSLAGKLPDWIGRRLIEAERE